MKNFLLRGAMVAVAAIGLAGCTAYDGYGYSGLSIGYGNYGGYHRPYYRPYYGWYDGYYYPGTGYYIYDRYGSRYRWSDRYRSYWEARRPTYRYRDNWSGYHAERRDDDRREYRQERWDDHRAYRAERREDRRDYRRDRRQDRRDRPRSRRD